jgi:hypothetical protein
MTGHPRQNVDSASQDPELLRRLLRAKDRMDTASHRTFRDVTGESPGAFRARGAPLTIVVSEKRRREATDINGSLSKLWLTPCVCESSRRSQKASTR